MRRALLILIATLMSLSANAEMYEMEQIRALYDKELSGVRAYLDGRFESSFRLLSDTARKGMKESQYLLSLMFMKGEGVDKSVLIGLGWLGVAIESGNEEWNNTFNTLYEAMSDAQRAMIDSRAARIDGNRCTCCCRPVGRFATARSARRRTAHRRIAHTPSVCGVVHLQVEIGRGVA